MARLETAARGARSPSPGLRYPVFAARAADGTTVVADELAIGKSLPLRAWYRTLRLDPYGAVLADSAEWGDDDAYGFLASESLAILRVTQWQLVLLSPAGERVSTLDLSRLSKRMPLIASPTPQGTFLVAFADDTFAVDVVEIDATGRLLWYLPHLDRLGYPGSVQLLRNGNLLVADEFCHVVVELARDGSVVQQVGSWRDPGRRGNRLSSPRAACEAARRCVAGRRHPQRPRPEGGEPTARSKSCRTRRRVSPRRRLPSSCRTATCSFAMPATAASSSTTMAVRSPSNSASRRPSAGGFRFPGPSSRSRTADCWSRTRRTIAWSSWRTEGSSHGRWNGPHSFSGRDARGCSPPAPSSSPMAGTGG